MERNSRKTRVGVVVSDKMDKTVVVAVKDNVKHPLYKKIMKQEGNVQRMDLPVEQKKVNGTLRQYLEQNSFVTELVELSETDSTNRVAKELAGKVENLLPMTLQTKYFDLPEQKAPAARPLFG